MNLANRDGACIVHPHKENWSLKKITKSIKALSFFVALIIFTLGQLSCRIHRTNGDRLSIKVEREFSFFFFVSSFEDVETCLGLIINHVSCGFIKDNESETFLSTHKFLDRLNFFLLFLKLLKSRDLIAIQAEKAKKIKSVVRK